MKKKNTTKRIKWWWCICSSDNEVRVKGLTSENLKITEQIVPKPFKVGNYEVTQEMIDNAEDPDIFKTMGIEDTMIADNVYDVHPEVKRLGDLIYDIYLPFVRK